VSGDKAVEKNLTGNMIGILTSKRLVFMSAFRFPYTDASKRREDYVSPFQALEKEAHSRSSDNTNAVPSRERFLFWQSLGHEGGSANR
jgi:hypothetical protein